MSMQSTPITYAHIQEDQRRMTRAVMAWYGWGSPVGLGLMLVAIGVAAWLLRQALLGG